MVIEVSVRGFTLGLPGHRYLNAFTEDLQVPVSLPWFANIESQVLLVTTQTAGPNPGFLIE